VEASKSPAREANYRSAAKSRGGSDIGFDLFGRPWDLALLAECFLGVRRFDQFQERLGISRKTLSQRLSSLVEDGVLVREQYQSRPQRFEYLLTEKGRDLFPIIQAIKDWGDRWDQAASDDR